MIKKTETCFNFRVQFNSSLLTLGPLSTIDANPIGIIYTNSAGNKQRDWTDIQVLFQGYPKREEGIDKDLFAMAPLLFRPKSEGSIQLRSKNPEDQAIVDPKFFSDPSDVEALVDSMQYQSTSTALTFK
jgi:choline dehydrogenase-like flavoprotein